LKSLFSVIFQPDDFDFGIVVPLLKDSHTDVNDSNNYMYRPTTFVYNYTSKLFEQYVLFCFHALLGSSDLQFGFKKKLGYTSALFTLRQTMDYLVSRRSSVFLLHLVQIVPLIE